MSITWWRCNRLCRAWTKSKALDHLQHARSHSTTAFPDPGHAAMTWSCCCHLRNITPLAPAATHLRHKRPVLGDQACSNACCAEHHHQLGVGVGD